MVWLGVPSGSGAPSGMLARRWPRSFHNTLRRVGMPIAVARCRASSWRRTSSPLGVMVKYEPTSAADWGYASKTMGWTPARCRASARVGPAMPPPMMSAVVMLCYSYRKLLTSFSNVS